MAQNFEYQIKIKIVNTNDDKKSQRNIRNEQEKEKNLSVLQR